MSEKTKSSPRPEHHPSLTNLLSEHGRSISGSVERFSRLATAAQQYRFRINVSDREVITRSTALWALMAVDKDVEASLSHAGVDRSRLAEVLTLASFPSTPADRGGPLDALFAAAMRAYLTSTPAGSEIGPRHICAAILESSGTQTGGELHGRLKRLGINYGMAFTALGFQLPEWAATVDGPADTSSGETYSRSVRSARAQLGALAKVTPTKIAAALQQDHQDYVGGRFASVPLRRFVGPTATVEEWLERVRALYNPQAVASSKHEVLDGQLLLLGLAELDEYLAQDLSEAGILDLLRNEVEVLPRRGATDHVQLTSDDPTGQDLLGRRFLAKALGDRLRVLNEDATSFLIHIDGPWGSGKSTLFRLIAADLKNKPDPKDNFLLVEVNAWREQRVGVQWWTLYDALRRAVAADSAHGWTVRARSRVDAVRTRLFTFLAALLVVFAVLVGLWMLGGPDIKAGGVNADAVVKIASLLALGVAGVTAAYRFLLPESGRTAQAFVSAVPNPMAEVRQLFARTLDRTSKPVVFLIDDLDRCDEDYVVDFLEVLQTLVRDSRHTSNARPGNRSRGVCALVAADGKWIRACYENHYASLQITGGPGRPLGYLFLEKVFQLSIRLPWVPDESKQAFYESLLGPGTAGDGGSQDQEELRDTIRRSILKATSGPEISRAAAAIHKIENPVRRMELRGDAAVRFSEPGIQAEAGHALARFGKYVEANPRSIKIFVNSYGMLQSLRTLEGIPIHTDRLARWALIEIRWPLLADYLRSRPEDIHPSHTGMLPKPIRTLLADPDVRSIIDDPELGPLTPDAVRECTGRASGR